MPDFRITDHPNYKSIRSRIWKRGGKWTELSFSEKMELLNQGVKKYVKHGMTNHPCFNAVVKMVTDKGGKWGDLNKEQKIDLIKYYERNNWKGSIIH